MEQISFFHSLDSTEGFIRKVYGIFTFQIVASAVFVGAAVYNPKITTWQLDNMWVFYLCMVVGLVS